ncbi:MAG: FAD:protein FMN transferase [Filifactor alocis]|nr:FAD:protein FMN transferase [Filifactor alocis]
MYKKMLVMMFICLTLILTGCAKKDRPSSHSEFVMDTLCTITLYESDDARMSHAFDILKGIEADMSNTVETSEISLVNASAGKEAVIVSESTFHVIRTALEYSRESDGSFDVSIAPLVDVWNINSEHPSVPSDDEIHKALSKISWNDVELDESSSSVFLKREGMKLDLGGIAKGYAADAVANYFTEEGVTRALINLGGNVFVHGAKEDSSPWNIGIQDPTTSQERAIATVKVKEGTAVVTSGIYQRYFEQEGKLYHHILSPKDGRPVDNELVSVTIITKSSMEADALSTTMFTLGLEKGLDYINASKKSEAIFIKKDGSVYLSEGLKDVFELISPEFNLVDL